MTSRLWDPTLLMKHECMYQHIMIPELTTPSKIAIEKDGNIALLTSFELQSPVMKLHFSQYCHTVWVGTTIILFFINSPLLLSYFHDLALFESKGKLVLRTVQIPFY
jgi:hypothetical protein